MKYCINTRMLSYDLTLIDKIKIASESGFNGIEPWVEEIEKENAEDIVNCCGDYGIAVPSVIVIRGWFENDGDLMGVGDCHREIMDECKRRMELSAKIGSKWIVAAPAFSHRNHYGIWEQGVDYFRELIEIGKSIGCEPTLEFMGQTDQIKNFQLCKKFIDDVGDDATMVIDSYHVWRSGGDLREFVDLPKERISVFHISDADKEIERTKHRDRDRVMPLSGKIDLYGFAEAIKKIGYDGFINAGVYNNLLHQMDQKFVADDCLRRMKQLFHSGNV